MKRKRNVNKPFSLVDEWFDECYNAEVSLKRNANSSHTIEQSEELSTNLPFSQAHPANPIHMHSDTTYVNIQTSGNNAHLIRPTFHFMTDPNSNIIRKDHENYTNEVVPVSKHLSSSNVASMHGLDGSHLRTLNQSNHNQLLLTSNIDEVYAHSHGCLPSILHVSLKSILLISRTALNLMILILDQAQIEHLLIKTALMRTIISQSLDFVV